MIKATVRYTSRHILALQKQFGGNAIKKSLVGIIISWIITIAYSGYIAWFVVKYGMSSIILRSTSLTAAVTFLGIALTVFFFLRCIRSTKSHFTAVKNMKEMKPVRELRQFVFDDEKFCMLCEREGFYIDQRIHYSELVSAVESEDFFFITIEQGRVCIIGKDELTEGTPQELHALLAEKLMDRFSQA